MPLTKLNATQGLTGTLPAVSGANLTNIDGGKILQFVHSSNNYAQGYTSTSAEDFYSASGTVWETTITPTSSSSKILLIEALTLYNAEASGNPTDQERRWFLQLHRKIGSGSYSEIRGTNWLGHYYYNGSQRMDLLAFPFPFTYYDTPNTTSAVTYKYMIGMHGGNRKVSANGDGKTSTLNCFEVAQ